MTLKPLFLVYVYMFTILVIPLLENVELYNVSVY